MKVVKALSAVALAAAAASSHAVVVFSDGFEANANGENKTPAGWTVLAGSIDILGAGYAGNLCTAAGMVGNCLDLDGTTGNAGITLKVDIPVVAGMTYVASFDLAGSQRQSIVGQTIRGITYTQAMVDNTVEVGFGTFPGGVPGDTAMYSLLASDTATTYSLTFTAASNGFAALVFDNYGNDNVGALLDNVVVTAVPEPETIAMMLAGLGLIGFLQRRRS